MRRTDLIIIGGGPAGLFLSSLVKDSILLEKNERPGAKLLVTGGGMCNFTHENNPAEMRLMYFEKKSFVAPSIGSFTPTALRSWFEAHGVRSFVREDGCVFPESRDAESVRAALVKAAGEIALNTTVLSVRKEGDGFITETDNGIFISNKLAITTGGMSYPGLGSTGDGYAFAKALGHRIVPPLPALSEIRMERNFPSLEGLSLSDVKLMAGGEKAEGAVVFTRRGISGPAAMALSREINGKTKLTISFAALDKEVFLSKGSIGVKRLIKEATSLPSSLIEALLPFGDKKAAELKKEERNLIIKEITAFETMADTAGMMKSATVTKGGVDTTEVNSKSMESKLVKNLYFAGEVLDVDGRCGGYNLHFAFASAYAASRAINS
jgi:flavoprotein, HI0933 family